MTDMSANRTFLSSLKKPNSVALALCWCFGLLLGILAASTAGESIIPLMRGATGRSASIVSLLVATLLPFLISAFVVSYCDSWLLLIICLMKAFLFAYCAFGVTITFGQSSWLLRSLFLFSDICMIPVLYYYWLRHLSGAVKSSLWENLSIVMIAMMIGLVDYCWISPFLVEII